MGILGMMKAIRHDEERKTGKRLHPFFLAEEHKEAEKIKLKKQYNVKSQKEAERNRGKSAVDQIEPLLKF